VSAVCVCACLGGCAADEGVSRGDRGRAADVVVKRDAARTVAREDAAPARFPPTRQAPARVVVTRHDPTLPAGCRPRPLARRIAAFFDAFNRGDPSAVAYVDPSDGWYSVTDGRRRHFVTYSRHGLPTYFARRHRQGERLRLLEVDVSFARGLGHVAYVIERRADDLRRLGIMHTRAIGKGTVSCETREIVVWSMGMPPGRGHPAFQVCPPPREPTRAIVACARRGG
jgi:hypothetical protein